MVTTEFIVEDGVCKLRDRSAFAGSIATSDLLIRVMRDEVGFKIYEALSMLTAVPAEIMGLNKGLLKEGFDGDIIVFDDNATVPDVFVMDKKVYKSYLRGAYKARNLIFFPVYTAVSRVAPQSGLPTFV